MFSNEHAFQDRFCVNSLWRLDWCSFMKWVFSSHNDGNSLLHSKHLGICCFPDPWWWWRPWWLLCWQAPPTALDLLWALPDVEMKLAALRLKSSGISLMGGQLGRACNGGRFGDIGGNCNRGKVRNLKISAKNSSMEGGEFEMIGEAAGGCDGSVKGGLNFLKFNWKLSIY